MGVEKNKDGRKEREKAVEACGDFLRQSGVLLLLLLLSLTLPKLGRAWLVSETCRRLVPGPFRKLRNRSLSPQKAVVWSYAGMST
jgi:hypothetical protein